MTSCLVYCTPSQCTLRFSKFHSLF